MIIMDNNIAKEKMAQLEWYIQKHCLWQYNSRGRDREVQNERILGKTKQLLCGENAHDDETIPDRYYWSEATMLVESFKKYFPWIQETSKEDLAVIMQMLKDKMDYIMIKGSLNVELSKEQY